jgi:hypothetical protein
VLFAEGSVEPHGLTPLFFRPWGGILPVPTLLVGAGCGVKVSDRENTTMKTPRPQNLLAAVLACALIDRR